MSKALLFFFQKFVDVSVDNDFKKCVCSDHHGQKSPRDKRAPCCGHDHRQDGLVSVSDPTRCSHKHVFSAWYRDMEKML